jgi:hypothetical protein
MSISISQIDELRERTGVNYTDALEALKSCNEDILEAIVYLEKNKKARPSKTKFSGTGLSDKISALLRKGSITRIKMYKQEKTIISISVNIAVLIGLIMFPLIEFIAIGLLVALFTGHRFKLESSCSDTTKINTALDKVSNSVDHVKEKFSGSITVDVKDTAE